MKQTFLPILIALLYFARLGAQQNVDLTTYVNPLVGTDSKYELSNGNTYPAIALPWGMNFWTPQTNKMGNGWCYQYAANKIRGFKQTRQPSPWINDYGAFSIFATTGNPVFDENERESWFSHKAEIAKPHYYKVYLADYNTTVEITPTERAACFRITYPQTKQANLVVDAFFKNSYVKVFPDERKIIGYACNAAGGVPENFKNYFVIYADKEFEMYHTIEDGVMHSGRPEVLSRHSGAVVQFKTKAGEQVHLRIASSFISFEQAERNLEQEIGAQTFDQILEKGRAEWNRQLGKIIVEGGSDASLTTFYTALYRVLLFPRKFYEYNHLGEVVHYSPYNGKIEKGYMFTDNGFWDTFRAVFPLFTLVYPEINGQIMEGLANTYRESGWLPEWASPGHRNCMIGSNSAIIIADSYLKGIPNPHIDILYEAILKNSNNEGPIPSVGRYGVHHYNDLGYIPYDVGIPENTARTLEYAFADFAISRLAQKLNRPASETELFTRRAYNYRNVFDPSVNFMRGKNRDGRFQSPFRPDKWGDAFTEGCAWHWTWCVFHDVQGLIDLMGGKDKFAEKMDSVFVAAPTFDYSYYGIQIHEITEMLVMNMGQYAHGNQPIQHMPYLYNYAGQPWKTQQKVREIMDRLYAPTPDGLCGDEDNGQTSAWYVFSAMGMYPVAPSAGQYVLGSPLFGKIILQPENGNAFEIRAPGNNHHNIYIREAQLNSKPYTRNFINHSEFTKGGVLELQMTDTPNRQRGIQAEDFPFSMTPAVKR